jgi:hypothetical protein
MSGLHSHCCALAWLMKAKASGTRQDCRTASLELGIFRCCDVRVGEIVLYDNWNSRSVNVRQPMAVGEGTDIVGFRPVLVLHTTCLRTGPLAKPLCLGNEPLCFQ